MTDLGRKGWSQVAGNNMQSGGDFSSAGTGGGYGHVGGDNYQSPGEKSYLVSGNGSTGFSNQQDDWSYSSQQGSKASSPKSPTSWGYQNDMTGSYQSDEAPDSKATSPTSPTSHHQQPKTKSKEKADKPAAAAPKKWDNKWGDDELWESLNN